MRHRVLGLDLHAREGGRTGADRGVGIGSDRPVAPSAVCERLDRVAELAGARDDERQVAVAPAEAARKEPGGHRDELDPRARALERREPERERRVVRGPVARRDDAAYARGLQQARELVDALVVLGARAERLREPDRLSQSRVASSVAATGATIPRHTNE